MEYCCFCGEKMPFNVSHETFIEWMEVHSPAHCPAHRKCTDACEAAACSILSARYAEQPHDYEGLEFVPVSKP